MKSKGIIYFLSKVPDSRRGQGKRHYQELILLIVLMATMSGYNGYRAIGDFIEKNYDDLLLYLKPDKDRLPTFYTVRRVLMNISYEELSKQFYQWSKSYIEIKSWEWLSIDGKAIRGTSNKHANYQDFVNMVSIFASDQKMVLATGKIINSKESEIPTVRDLIKALDIEGAVLTLDALHCQKKQSKLL